MHHPIHFYNDISIWSIMIIRLYSETNQFWFCFPTLLYFILHNHSCSAEIREQCDEYPTVQLFTASVLATKLYGCLYMVIAICGWKRYVCFIKIAWQRRYSCDGQEKPVVSLAFWLLSQNFMRFQVLICTYSRANETWGFFCPTCEIVKV